MDYKFTNKNSYDNYESHARSNEDLRDAMDGKIDEPMMTQSQENTNNEDNTSEGEN